MNISAQEFSESNLSTFRDISRVVLINLLNLDHYLHEEIYARVDHVEHQNNPPLDIDEPHCHVTVALFRNYSYDHGHGIMPVYFSSTVNPDGSKYATAVHSVDGRK